MDMKGARMSAATQTQPNDKKSRKLDIHRIQVTVQAMGESPLVSHQWSEKAKKMIRDKQQKKARAAKEAKDPEAEFNAARYLDADGRDCVLAKAFKGAIVSAARFDEDWKMTVLRGAIFVEGDLLPLEYERMENIEDVVRVQNSADLRYRPYYFGWSTVLTISYNKSVISEEQVVDLIKQAGFAVGVGEGRPEKDGQNGRFEVVKVEAV